MTLQEFVLLVEEMRHEQKEFFRSCTRTAMEKRTALENAKRLEKRVDLACGEFRSGQKNLFDT